MTALTVTPASVAYVSGPKRTDQVAGEAFDAGASVYRSAAGTWLKAQSDGTAVEAGSEDTGIALFSADAAGARGTIAAPGAVVTLGTGTAGVVYCPGQTAGSLVPVADLGSGDKVTIAAIGIGSNRVRVARVYDAGAELA